MRFLTVALSLLVPGLLSAVEHTGTVRAADQFIPGATVTARLGGAKVVAYTDENGRYTLDLTPGDWEIEIKMFGFKTLTAPVSIKDQFTSKDWTLEMPRPGEPAETPHPAPAAAGPPKPAPAAAAPTTAAPATSSPAGNGGRSGRYGQGRQAAQGQGRGGVRGGTQQPTAQQTFQNANLTATDAGEQALAMTGADASSDLAATADTTDALTMNGSTSGGLAASSDDFARAGRGGRGGPGGSGGPNALGAGQSGNGLMTLGASLGGNGDPLGMGGFGAAGADAGFGGGAGFGLGGPGAGGPGGGGGRGGGGGAGGGGGGGRGGGRGGGGARAGRGGRGPFNGQFAQFGNRRGRNRQSPYQGSVAITAANSALNAAPFSLNGQSQPKPSSANETVAFNFGGPVRIPHIVHNDKWSFYVNFTNHEGRSASNLVNTVPSSAERLGDFSAATQSITAAGVRQTVPIVIFDPTSNTPFPSAIIPSNRLNSTSLGLLDYFPLPTYPSLTTYNYAIAQSTPSMANSLGVRLQGSVTNKDRVSFNQQYSRNSSTAEQLFGFDDTRKGYGLSSTAQWTHIFKPRINNSASVAFSRNISSTTPYFAYKTNIEGDLGITGTDTSPINYGPPTIGFTNFASLSDGAAASTRGQTTNFTDSFTYVAHKNHNLSFGFGYRRMQNNVLSYASSRGSFTFGGAMTEGIDCGGTQGQIVTGSVCSGTKVANSGYDFADFLLGYAGVSSLRTGNDNNYFRGWALNASAMDDWRVNRGLTINAGIRYEYFAPYTELYGHLANIDINPSFTAIDVVTAGGVGNQGIGSLGAYFGQYPASLVKGDPHAFSPRLGLAWRPSQKYNRLVRLGYSIFYSGSSYSGFASQMAAQPPFAVNINDTGTLLAPLPLQNGFIPQAVNNQYAINPNYKLGYAQTWTVALQQTLPHNVLMELEYVGIKGTGLPITLLPNQPTIPADNNAPLRIPNASSFTYQTDVGNSIMHAAQVRLTRRFTRGLSAVALYTFSKSIDDLSNQAQDPYNLNLERALSSNGQRHRLNFNYVASSPVGVRGLWRNGGWKTRLLSGWTTSGGFTYATGMPLTPTVAGVATSSRFYLRPNTTGAPLYAPGYPFFNLAAFSTTPPVDEYGDAGRNIITGVPTLSLNAQLNRAWRFGESRKQIQLSFRTNNVLNHVYFTSFGTVVGSSSYGQPTSPSATRTVTCNLRFNF